MSQLARPGFYWLIEAGMPPHLVEVDIESDSHGMFFVVLPGEDHRYPPALWPDAAWVGPVDPLSLLMISPGTS
jgi:hypothetical protein